MLTIDNPFTGEKIQIALADCKWNVYDDRIPSWYKANQVCQELGNGWRLPTKIELTEMFKQLYLNRKGNLGWADYWSSTESSEKDAWKVSPNEEWDEIVSYIQEKSESGHVRAVRTL